MRQRTEEIMTEGRKENIIKRMTNGIMREGRKENILK
jgi:ribosomal protein S7